MGYPLPSRHRAWWYRTFRRNSVIPGRPGTRSSASQQCAASSSSCDSASPIAEFYAPQWRAGRSSRLTQRATGDAIPTRIRDNCQVAISFATRTLDGAVAALGEEIRQHPDASPVLLNDPASVGVAVTSLPGRPGFQRVRTPQVDHHQVAALIRATAGLRADPGELLLGTARPLRLVEGT